jgi:hypothetical protein
LLNDDINKSGIVFLENGDGPKLGLTAILFKTNKSYYIRFVSGCNQAVITVALGDKLFSNSTAGLISSNESSIDVLFCIKFEYNIELFRDNYSVTKQVYPLLDSVYSCSLLAKSFGMPGYEAYEFNIDNFLDDCVGLLTLALEENVFVEKLNKLSSARQRGFIYSKPIIKNEFGFEH